uniref:Uncharacterized protein n=1 Tax=Myotis myotis TaxID=51298 RepID=A0A7J7TIN4_MYOMY|nr:hypothetical protein mMyoMyo1_009062 [Myotis myotis]
MRNIFRDLCPFSYPPKLLLHLQVSLQVDPFLLQRETWNRKDVSEATGTAGFPLLSREFRGRRRRLLYLPHNIRALVYLKCGGIERPNFKSAGERKSLSWTLVSPISTYLLLSLLFRFGLLCHR